MTGFDRIIVADWSAAGSLSPRKPSANAIWLGMTDRNGTETRYFRSRAEAEAFLIQQIRNRKGRLLIGFDFPMGYPAGFAERLTGHATARAVWDWLSQHLSDAPDNRNNRFETAARINSLLGGAGPFWGRPRSLPLPDLPETKAVDYQALGLAERRQVERVVPRAQPVWKLYTTGAAGGQGLVGQAMIHRLSQHPDVAVWPFDTVDAPVVLAEVYPSLLQRVITVGGTEVLDAAQVRILSRALWNLSQSRQLAPLFATPDAPVTTEEGWILGVGHGPALEQAAQ